VKHATASLVDHLMDMNNAPEPRMPPVENLQFLYLVGVIPRFVQCRASAFEPRLADGANRLRNRANLRSSARAVSGINLWP
jgi:hypothetical protein